MAKERVARALPVLWSASQHRIAAVFLLPGDMAMETDAYASQSERANFLGTDGPQNQALASSANNLASLSRAETARYHLRQEPGAVAPHAGICARGRR